MGATFSVTFRLLKTVDGWLWVVYAVAFVQSCFGIFNEPADNSLLPALVGEERLATANSLNATNNNLARLAGPALERGWNVTPRLHVLLWGDQRGR